MFEACGMLKLGGLTCLRHRERKRLVHWSGHRLQWDP